MWRSALGFIGFYVGWYACVGGAAAGIVWLGPLVAIVLATLLLALSAAPRGRHLGIVLALAAGGTLLDSLLMALGGHRFAASPWALPLAPPWITGLWLLFGATLDGPMAWMRGRPLVAAAFGAIGGPLSYAIGARMGAMSFPESGPLLPLLVVGAGWALATPLAVGAVERALHRPANDPAAASPKPA